MNFLEVSLTAIIAVTVVNFVMAICFWTFSRLNQLYRANMAFWGYAILSFAGQGLGEGHRAALPAAFAITLFSNLELCKMIAYFCQLPKPRAKPYLLAMAGACLWSVPMAAFGPFWLAALPVVAALVAPVAYTVKLAIARPTPPSAMVKLFFLPCLLLILHQLDFPFLRMNAKFAPYGFMFATFYSMSFGMIAPVAITEIVQSYLFNKESRLRRSYQKFFPDRYMRVLKKDSILDVNETDGVLVPAGAILFSDLRNFTSITEKMSGAEVLSFIRTYLQSFPILKSSSGIVDKYIGDSVMIAYPADTEKALIEARTLVSSERHPTAVGIGFGEYTVGVIGQKDNLNISVFGSCVNEASRLCSFAKVFDAKILMTESYYLSLSEDSQKVCRYVGRFAMRGKHDLSVIYECWDVLPESRREMAVADADLLQEAIAYYEQERFEACLKIMRVIESQGHDAVASYYRSLCEGMRHIVQSLAS